ncbi:MAG: hypothetical protein JRI45_11140 [Deltaproteobacteria bacterium]|nr:hypothetical protein [Deltaproteobacteria bacterium]MBW2068941.1 hypothetical protein [Deltaproteobacteria bacterium]
MKHSEAEKKFIEWMKDQPIPVDEELCEDSSRFIIEVARECFLNEKVSCYTLAESDEFLLKIIRQEVHLDLLVPLRPIDKEAVAEVSLACIALIRNENLPWSERVDSVYDMLFHVYLDFVRAVLRKDHAASDDEMNALCKGEIPPEVVRRIVERAYLLLYFFYASEPIPQRSQQNVRIDLWHFNKFFLTLPLPFVERKRQGQGIEVEIEEREYKYPEQEETEHGEQFVIPYDAALFYVWYMIAIGFRAVVFCDILRELINNGCGSVFSVATELGLLLGELAALATADEVPFIALLAHKTVSCALRHAGALEKNKDVKAKIIEYAMHKFEQAKLTGKKVSCYTLAEEVYRDLLTAKRIQESGKAQRNVPTSAIPSLLIGLDLNKIPTSSRTIYNWLRDAGFLPSKKRKP